jgi:hypothetical protein
LLSGLKERFKSLTIDFALIYTYRASKFDINIFSHWKQAKQNGGYKETGF